MIIMIDNYDSFVYNLVQIIGDLGHEINVFRNDEVTINEIEEMNPDGLVISPGPCSPKEAGISKKAIEVFGSRIPVFGVCLGHQCIGAVYGGTIIRADIPMHGKISRIRHIGKFSFQGIEDPVEVVRYHSLIIDKNSLPECLLPTAFSDKGEIMGVKHKVFDVEGVQFHPESVFTGQGKAIIHNFIKRVQKNHERNKLYETGNVRKAQ